ncbi:conjugal transfer protein TraA [Enterobacteriaceae bacterium EKM102V]|uniref:conjugal transfer protein TraA n=2 Tax=Pantoea TaxID=53335 RepID=UPI00142DBA89|nr:conjugal transfer protein TraA [Pantoea sp. EKM103V]KAF6653110.1 conjugal transfer protein TraA [Enterobacteriaceae bacterium EKM102V]KAF6663523.1 conjugal transfer protein TraA [Pantoea sp. EKM103V]
MKVVTSHPAPVQGSAEACPPRSGTAAQGLIGIARRAFTLIHRYRTNVMLACLAIAVFTLPHFAGATDLLATQKQDAKDTFGHGSTVEWGLYIAEIILSVGAYIKVRNPMILVGGIPFLIVITRVFFSLAG